LADALHSFPATKTMGKIKKVTTSERSASQIYRKQKALWREFEGPRQRFLVDALGRAFRPQTTTEVKKVTNSERSRGTCCFSSGSHAGSEFPEVGQNIFFRLKGAPRQESFPAIQPLLEAFS
jgi:hypothetical protein